MSGASREGAFGAAERAARASYGRLVAFLAARTRDVAGAEDALAEAFASALRMWPADGVPENPDAWLLTVARRRQADAARRRRTETAGTGHLVLMAEELGEAVDGGAEIPDRRLVLMFACAHPAIEAGMRSPLILQTVLGFNAAEIAAAFLVPPATMGQRLVRAKTRLRDAGIPFRVPDREELAGRLDAVLEAVYAAYARGWAEAAEPGTPRLAEEAIWLARLVVSLLPDQPEAKGLLALMLYAEARRPARRGPDGAYVPLDEQDTTLWNRNAILEAEAVLRSASESGANGRYQIEAAIQSAHIARRTAGAETWPAVLAMYDHLLAVTASPVVALNRAVALGEVDGPRAGLAALLAIADDRRLRDYQPYWAARGFLAARAGETEEARGSLILAIGLSDDEAERRYIEAKLAVL